MQSSSCWPARKQTGCVDIPASNGSARILDDQPKPVLLPVLLLLLLLLFLADLSLVDTLPGETLCGQSVIAVKAHPQVRGDMTLSH
jgi:hypothetical protein